ncbi:hypothetical protein JCM16358_22860 [Halanaerocella petrolearia]
MPSRMMNDRTELAGRIELLAEVIKDGDYQIKEPTFNQLKQGVNSYLKLLLPDRKEEPKIDYVKQDFDGGRISGIAFKRIKLEEVIRLLDKIEEQSDKQLGFTEPTGELRVKDIKQIERIDFTKQGFTKYLIKIGVNQNVIEVNLKTKTEDDNHEKC